MLAILNSPVWGAGHTGVVQVSATVAATVQHAILQQETRLLVTPEHIARGYVDAPLGTVLAVKSNDVNGYFLAVSIDSLVVREASLSINGRVVGVPFGGGLIHQDFAGRDTQTVRITYRLWLSPTVQPGSYQWPVMVEASPL